MWALTTELRAQHARHGAGHRAPSETRRQIHPPHAVGKVRGAFDGELPRHRLRDARLADAARADDGDHGVRREQRLDRLDIAGPAEEHRQSRGNVGGDSSRRRDRNGFGHRRRSIVGNLGAVRPGRRLRRTRRAARSDSPARDRRQRARPEQLAQRRDLHLQVVLLDHQTGPHERQELVLGDEPARACDQRDQQVEAARPQRDRLAVGQQAMLPGLEGEVAETVGRRFESRCGRGHGDRRRARAESISPPGCIGKLASFSDV